MYMEKECKEYNSLKYRTLISTGNPLDSTVKISSDEQLEMFLSKDIEDNRKEVWSKLSKTEKHKRLKQYIDTHLSSQYELTDIEKLAVFRYFTGLIDNKKLNKTSDISYNRDERTIDAITGLIFNPITRRFIIHLEKQNKTMKKTHGQHGCGRVSRLGSAPIIPVTNEETKIPTSN